MKTGRAAGFAAHVAARDTSRAAQYAARAAGQTPVATSHMADHELDGVCFALVAIQASVPDDPEALGRVPRWQREMMPLAVAELALDDMRRRSGKFMRVFDRG